MGLPTLPDTLLSTTQKFNEHDAFPHHVNHPFSSNAEETCGLLQDLINATHQISTSIGNFAPATSLVNQKLISTLRQYSLIAHTLHTSDQNIRHLAQSLRETGKGYGEDIPLDSRLIADWCISRLASWGASAGMETFKDNGKEGTVTVLLGGKVLVIDVDFSIDQSQPGEPTIKHVNVKTSYATANEASTSANNTNGSPYLDRFLGSSIQKYCDEVQHDEASPDTINAAESANLISQQLRYLVLLDSLAARKGLGGVKWFIDMDQLYPMLENVAREEAALVATSLCELRAPLDIFLRRSHALPLPYLNCPSLSFLVYLSPRGYLSCLKQRFQQLHPTPEEQQSVIPLDIDLGRIRTYLTSRPEGATVATLRLCSYSGPQLYPSSMSMPSFLSRPTFPLSLKGAELEHVFLEAPPIFTDTTIGSSSSIQNHSWLLDFTHGGRTEGIVLSQSRMRDIEMVVNPLSGMDHLPPVSILSFQSTSWVSLLLNPTNPFLSERYIATYRSPTHTHPPLSLRITAPDEPGFLLQKVPVHSMKEVWGILEIVRDQCWVNEVLCGHEWTTASGEDVEDDSVETDATEQELNAILSGTMTPRKIPVTVDVQPNDPTADSLFAAALDTMAVAHLPPRRPRILMTSPERPPMSGLVRTSVIYDETKPRGISVEVNGAMGAEFENQELEEICRRGGALGLPGRIWARSQTP
ncbi:hypothetical protein AX17_005763 [Amanita inopinata Kibby_2008]|nr:hypothetical protein AX17_005763 [Amanita inopinata Kibby_2008]